MMEAHARNPKIRGAGKRKTCSLCGLEGHNKKTCPTLHPAESEEAGSGKRITERRGAAAQQAEDKQRAQQAAALQRLLEELRANGSTVADGVALPPSRGAEHDEAGGDSEPARAPAAEQAEAQQLHRLASLGDHTQPAAAAPDEALVHLHQLDASQEEGNTLVPFPCLDASDLEEQRLLEQSAAGSSTPLAGIAGVGPPLSQRSLDLVPTFAVAPGMSLSAGGAWVFPLPTRKEECVQQAAQVSRAQCKPQVARGSGAPRA